MTLLNLFLKKITNYNTQRIVQEGARTEIIEFFKKAEKALTEENIGDKFIRTVKKTVKGEANVAEEVNIGNEINTTIKSAQPRTTLFKQILPKTLKDLGLSSEEETFYKKMLEEYKQIKPEETLANPYTETVTRTTEHVNGAKSTFCTFFEKVKQGVCYSYEEVRPKFTLEDNGRRLYVNIDKVRIDGDEALVQELTSFLQNSKPTVENLKKFLEYRDIEYMKKYGITDFTELKKSVEKGKQIVKQEQNYYKQQRDVYNDLWSPLHTEKFYRVIGKEELIEALSGKRVVSKNSSARYGRDCVDISNDPYYHGIFYDEQKYRITFKVKDADGGYHTSFTERIFDFRPEKNHYQVSSYNINDISEIHAWNGSDWVKVNIK